MRILVTGGCGFIGSHLVDELLRSHHVAVLDDLSKGKYFWGQGGPALYQGSILERSFVLQTFESFAPEMVFHMAAHHYIPFCEQNPHDAFATNVTGTINVIDAAHRCGSLRKFFFASTGDVYPPSGYPHSETDTPSPVYVYGESKLVGESIIRRYKSSVGVPFDIVIGRIFNAAGPRETNPHLLPEIVRQIAAGANRIEVGNTWPVRDFVDVLSMAKVIAQITQRVAGIDIFNIGSGHAVKVQEVIDVLIGARQGDVNVVSVEARKRPNDRAYLCPAVTKLRQLLGHAAEPFSAATAQAIWAEPAQTRLLYA
jgi:UDP-glucose 4-epimerase